MDYACWDSWAARLWVALVGTLALACGAVAQPGSGDPAWKDALEVWEQGGPLTHAQAEALRPWLPSGPARHSVGPDLFGYQIVDSSEPDGPGFDWIDITATGTEIAAGMGLGDEDVVGPFDLGFDFPWYDDLVSQLWVQSNGVLTFTPNYILPQNQPLPFSTYNALIAWFWDDLDPDNGQDGGQVYVESRIVETQPAFVVSFIELDEYPDGPNQDTITAQVILFEDGRVKIQYLALDPGLDIASATIGAQGPGGESGLTYLHNGVPAGLPTDSLAVEIFRRSPDAILWGTVTDTTDGRVLPGMTVSAQGHTAVTGALGRFFLFGLYPGESLPVHISGPGYYSRNDTLSIDSGFNRYSTGLYPWAIPQTQFFLSTFEPNRGRFQPVDLPSNWAWGVPTQEPDSASSGSRVWQTVLNGNYGNRRDDWLASRQSFLILDDSAYLRYRHWYDIEADYDGYNVHVSTDAGESWQLIHPDGAGYSDFDGVPANGGEPCFNNTDGALPNRWATVRYSLAAYSGQQVWLGFRFVSDAVITAPGVAIDDIEVYNGARRSAVAMYSECAQDTLPPNGGVVSYFSVLSSDLGQTREVDVWTEVQGPGGGVHSPLDPFEGAMAPGLSTVSNRSITLPGFAPPGAYLVRSFVGVWPDTIGAASRFTVVKRAATDGPMAAAALAADVEPGSTGLSLSASPNPSNAATVVSFTLPEADEVRLDVFTIEGRRVLRLLDELRTSGEHRVALPTAGLASGLYLIRLETSRFSPLSVKLVVVK